MLVLQLPVPRRTVEQSEVCDFEYVGIVAPDREKFSIVSRRACGG